MNDEEKKAIDSLKVISEYAGDNYLAKEHRRKLKMLIELVKKQSEEIEELKDNNELLQKNYSSAYEDINWFCEKYISKKESEQKERKAYIKGTNDADKLCNKKWKDKIKAKIEFIKGLNEKLYYEENVIELLESLLEKE